MHAHQLEVSDVLALVFLPLVEEHGLEDRVDLADLLLVELVDVALVLLFEL